MDLFKMRDWSRAQNDVLLERGAEEEVDVLHHPFLRDGRRNWAVQTQGRN